MSEVKELTLQTCGHCGHVQYPDRELCAQCLSEDIGPRSADNHGRLLSWTLIHASFDPAFRGRGPWRVGTVMLDCGPIVVAHLSHDLGLNAPKVQLASVAGPDGRPAWMAYPAGGRAPVAPFAMHQDPDE